MNFALPCAVPLLALTVAACGGRVGLPAPAAPLSATPLAAVQEAPSAAPPSARGAPSMQEFALDNGLRVFVRKREHGTQVSVGFLSLRAGEDAQGLESSGLASIIAELVSTYGLKPPDDSPATASASADSPSAGGPVPVSVGSLSFQHAAGLSTRVSPERLGVALRALARRAMHPTLDQAALIRARRMVSSQLAALRDNPRGIARNHIMQRLYGPNHPLGQHAKMAIMRAASHELGEVEAGYRARFVPSASVLIVVGDVEAELVHTHAEAAFGQWAAQAKAKARYPTPSWAPQGRRNTFLHIAGARRAFIAVGQKAPSPHSPDFEAFAALTHILAGSATSRLYAALRDEQGATYHVGALLAPRRDGSTLVVETATSEDAAEAATLRIGREMARLQAEPVSNGELHRAKQALLNQLHAELSTEEGMMRAFAFQLSLGLGADALAQRAQQIASLTKQQLQAVAVRHLSPEAAPAMIIGDLTPYGTLGQWARSDDVMLPRR